MTFEMPDRPPESISLRWLYRVMKSLSWLMMFCTIVAIVIYVGQQLFHDSYRPSLGNMLVTICVLLAMGGITVLFLLGLTKLTQIWAEVLDSGRQKTDLLATLMTDPTPHE